MNILHLLAGFGACALLLACYCFIRWQIDKIERERIQKAKRTTELPVEALRVRKPKFGTAPNYAVSTQEGGTP